MRHRVKKIPKLGRKPDHRKMLLRNLATSILTHGKIQTTLAKARAVEPFVNRLISNVQGRPAQLAIRTLKAELFSEESMKKLLDFVQKNEGKKSGFTRVTRLAPRPGDASMKVFIELV